MRAVQLVLLCIPLALLSSCAGPMRPAVIAKLSELPSEPERRNAILDSSHAEPGPEQKQGKTKRRQKVETAAATAAAWIGILMSNSDNVTMGAASPVDENLLFEDAAPKRDKREQEDDAGDKAGDKTPPVPHDEPLVPWVQLKK